MEELALTVKEAFHANARNFGKAVIVKKKRPKYNVHGNIANTIAMKVWVEDTVATPI